MKVKVTVEIQIPNDYHPDMAAAIVTKGLQENTDEGLQNWQIVEVGRPTLEVDLSRVPKTCPRCGDWIPNNDTPGAYPGAISRVDNKTEICSYCGGEEATQQLFNGAPLPMSKWRGAE